MLSEQAGRRLCGAICAGVAAAISVAFLGFALAAAGLCIGCVVALLGAF
ncbi:MAG TPA: hypothetical protein VIK90_00255 [Limnochordales bacterium]